MVSDLIESDSPLFFSAGFRFVVQLKRMQKTWRHFLRSVIRTLLAKKQKKPYVFLNNEISEASGSRLFFAYVLLENEVQTSKNKIQGCDF